ncbi:MAG: peptide ABC transporter permease [Rhizobiales bacterium 65-9]|nr:ABC transporter permease [Hyphomicrobiales bacterium]OJY35593.1 MAG: peptide ABC transporter permease [Rhizobiales bacterium 65-9]
MSVIAARPSAPIEHTWRLRFAAIREFALEFGASPTAVVSLAALLVLVVGAVFAPVISPQNPYDLAKLSILDSRLPPGTESAEGYIHWLGTDGMGRDLLSAILYGLRISLIVGISSVVVALSIGLILGLAAAYIGGRADAALMRLVDLQMSFPPILVALVLLALLGRGVDKTVIALVAVQWAYYARTVRASALVEREREYVEAAKGMRLGHWRILTRHLLPNCLPPVFVVGTVQISHAITLEATLSFLGIGLPETRPSLGLLIANGYQYLLGGNYWISLCPGFALLALVLSINLVADRLRDMLNPALAK